MKEKCLLIESFFQKDLDISGTMCYNKLIT